jgi:hypothetical protein
VAAEQSLHVHLARRPAIAFSTAGGNLAVHQRTDAVEWLSAEKMSEVAQLTADIVEYLQDKTPEWARAA